VFEIGAGAGIRTLDFAVNRSMNPIEKLRLEVRRVSLNVANWYGLPPTLLYEMASADVEMTPRRPETPDVGQFRRAGQRLLPDE